MNLTIDIGNTAVKYALFEADRMLHKGIGVDQLEESLAKHKGVISTALITSVADENQVIEILRKFNIPFTKLSYETLLPIYIAYKTPKTLGTDRIALAVGAWGIFDQLPVLVIAAGTCITYNLVFAGNLMGGAISPGITMRFSALHDYTARLPAIDWRSYSHGKYDELTGMDTTTSIVSGVLNGVVSEIDGTIDQYRHRYSGLQVVLTGGDMEFLVKNLKNNIFARPDLVLEGLNYILLHHA